MQTATMVSRVTVMVVSPRNSTGAETAPPNLTVNLSMAICSVITSLAFQLRRVFTAHDDRTMHRRKHAGLIALLHVLERFLRRNLALDRHETFQQRLRSRRATRDVH